MARRWLRRAAELAGGGTEQRGKTGTAAAAAAIYSREVVARRRQRTPELATAPAACHRTRKRRKTLGGDIRVAPAASREVAFDWILIFALFTELPLRLICKLLTNFLKKLKISKNESCSIFQTLQLCFKEHFQILPPF